jgi:hypothetical protein
MLNIGNISLGRSTKRYSHDMSCDNNSTMSFGFFQPLYTQMMLKGDKLSLSARQLVRLAPMPVPTFGRMKLVNHAVYVPFSDVYPAYDALLAKVNVSTSVKTYIPTELPKITNSLLVAFLCSYHGIMTQWSLDVDRKMTRDTLTKQTAGNEAAKLFNSADVSIQGVSVWYHPVEQQYDNELEVQGCDFIFYSTTINKVVGFKMSTIGKRVYSLLRGLGYSLEVANNNFVSAVPILAFYKAWFDNYAPKRDVTWSNTAAYRLINYIYENNQVSLNANFVGNHYTYDFLTTLKECFYSTKPDYYSAQTSQPVSNGDVSDNVLGQPSPDPSKASPSLDNIIKQTYQGSGTSQTQGQPYVQAAKITLPMLQTLQRLSRFVAKDSVIGQRVSTWLRVHFGADVSNDFFKDSYDIKTFEVDCSVNDVFSTADTASGSGVSAEGEYLGAYAGKGIGFNDDKVSYEAPCAGYFILMSAIAPKASYYQGDDPSLYGLNRYTLPSADFDALGMELTPYACMVDNNGINISAAIDKNNDLTGKSFGYMPRFSGYKVKKDIINGDMVRPSTIDSYSPYHLDRIILKHHFTPSNDDGNSQLTLYTEDIPKADMTSWIFPTKFPWMGNFNRIFYNEGWIRLTQHEYNSENYVMEKGSDVIDDNFIIQSVFDVRLTNQLKPISESYDTFEQDTDNNSINVKTE